MSFYREIQDEGVFLGTSEVEKHLTKVRKSDKPGVQLEQICLGKNKRKDWESWQLQKFAKEKLKV